MTYNPDPANYTMKGNAPRQNSTTSPAEGLTEAQLTELLDNPDKLRNLAKKRLIEIIALSKATTVLVPAIKELLDRIDGKPAQSIAMTVKDESLDKVSTAKLIRLASMLDEPLVIAPMPKKLDVDTTNG